MNKKLSFFMTAAAIALGANAQSMADVTIDVTAGSTAATLYQPAVVAQSDAVALPVTATAPARVKQKAAASDMTGGFVTYYKSCTSSYGPTGSGVTLTANGNIIEVSGFHRQSNFKFNINVDGEGNATIAPQTLGTFQTYGDAVIAPCKLENNTLVVDSEATAIVGKVVNNDTIQFTGYWAIVLPDAASWLYTGQDLTFARANATFSMTDFKGNKYSNNAVVKQNGTELQFTNLVNFGETVSTVITGAHTVQLGGKIISKGQAAAYNMTLMRVHEYETNQAGEISKYTFTSDQVYAVATDSRTISYTGLWTAGGNMQSLTLFTDFNIALNFDLEMPVQPTLTGIEGEGTETSPYLIKTTDDWNNVAATNVAGCRFDGKWFKIVNDLDFSNKEFIPLSKGANPIKFWGNLDGGNHTITVDYTTDDEYFGALIGQGGEDITIKNLTVTGKFSFTGKRCAAVMGYAGYNTTFENVHNKADIYVNGTQLQMFAGIVAISYRKLYLTNCSNEGNIYYNSEYDNAFVGGLLGDNTEAYMTNCYNTGKFFPKNTTKFGVVGGIAARCSMGNFVNVYNTADIDASKTIGGLVGNASSNTVGLSATNCWNSGNITSYENNAKGTTAVAGLFQSAFSGSILNNCYNTGNITGSGRVAGVIGAVTGNSGYTIELHNCYNTGKISAISQICGGVLGYANNCLKMDSCYNTGEVVSTAYTAGGVAGQIQGTESHMTNCYNLGNVTADYYAGGVIGNIAAIWPLDNCWNAGDVTATSRAGGLVGYSGRVSLVNNCWNVGNVTATSALGGVAATSGHSIGGITGYAQSAVSDCYNAGKIIGASRVGGIAGFTLAATNSATNNTFDRVINYGEIVAPKDTCGHIAGTNLENNPKQWAETGFAYANHINQAYYLTGLNDENCIQQSVEKQVGLNVAQLCLLELGDNWNKAKEYCFPTLVGYENNPYAKLYSVAVVPDDVDLGTDTITCDFNVGALDGILWESSYSGITFNGNKASFNDQPYEGKVTLTAMIESDLPAVARRVMTKDNNLITREIVVNVNYKGNPTGVSDLNTDNRVVAVKYYNLQGVQVDDAANGVFIKVSKLDDGKTVSTKVIK